MFKNCSLINCINGVSLIFSHILLLFIIVITVYSFGKYHYEQYKINKIENKTLEHISKEKS